MGISREYQGPEKNVFIEHNHEIEHLRDINMMQIELAIRKYPQIESDDEKILKWTRHDGKKYSREFRILLDEELDADPNFWENFKSTEFRESLMKRIEAKLYADEEENKGKGDENHDDIVTLST